MNRDELLKRINNINIWKNGNLSAPNKPLLVLFALGQLQQSKKQFHNYEEVMPILKNLLVEFGPSRKEYSAKDPLYFMKHFLNCYKCFNRY